MQEVTMIEIDPVRALAAFRKALAEIAEFKEEATNAARKADDLSAKRADYTRDQYPMVWPSFWDRSQRELMFKKRVSRLEQEAKRAELALSAYRVSVDVADWVIGSEDGSYSRLLRESMISDQLFVEIEGPAIEKLLAEPISQPKPDDCARFVEVEPPQKKRWWGS